MTQLGGCAEPGLSRHEDAVMELKLHETIPGTEPQQLQGKPCQTPRAHTLHPEAQERVSGEGQVLPTHSPVITWKAEKLT